MPSVRAYAVHAFTGAVALVAAVTLPRPAPGLPPMAEFDTLLAGALCVASLAPADIGFRTDYEDPDPFRLAVVDQLLVNPRQAPATVDSLARALATEQSLAGLVHCAAVALSGGDVARGTAKSAPIGEEAVFAALGAGTSAGWAEALAALTAEDRGLLRREGPELLRLDETEAALGVDAVAAAEASAREMAERVLAGAARLDRRALLGAMLAAAELADAAAAAAPGLGSLASLPPWDGAPPAVGDVRGTYRLADGRPAVVGGPGSTRYLVPCGLIIDLGGDDVYESGAGGNGGVAATFALTIDVAGNDVYNGESPFALAAGLLGGGILVDLAGNDLYRSGDCGLGAGFCGLGLLDDRGGDDRYLGGSFTVGAGAFGIGILRDAGGRDLYQGSTFTQGFGFVYGFGLLEDRTGEDVYLCQPRFSDLLRDPTTTLSMAQGFGYGLRPGGSGGIGLLVDGGGHDRYLAEVFAQGSAYWCALGGVVDRGGNDHFDGYNYVQGSGVHVAVAALIDDEGDDIYRAKGVSQGCGHDLALGALVDAAGNDRYDASDLAQGAGNANGAGILIDVTGDDAYSVRHAATSQGYGNVRRHQGSIGVLIDAGGVDRYLGADAGEDRLWQVGEHGIGVDAEREVIAAIGDLARARWPAVGQPPALGAAGSVPAPAREPLEPLPALAPLDAVLDSVRTLSFARLFPRAASGEPRFAAERDLARTEIVRRGRSSVRELAARLGTEVARERHAIKDLALLLGPEMVEKEFARVLGGSDERAARAAAWCLERTEARGVEPELMRAAEHTSWRVRAGSLVALARGGGERSVPVLTARLSDGEAPVRQAAAYALGERLELARSGAATPALAAAVPALVRALGDSIAGVRLAAGRALGRAGPLATPDLTAAIWAEEDPRRRLLAIEALGMGGDPRAVPVLKALYRVAKANSVAVSHIEVALAKLEGEVTFDATESAAIGAGLAGEDVRARAAAIIGQETRDRAATFCRRPDCMPAERGQQNR